MDEIPITQFGAPDAPDCNPERARFTIIPAPLEYTVCYMKGTQHGPQAILNASSEIELYDEELDCSPIDVGVYTRPALDYRGLDHATALKVRGDAVREVLLRKQIPLTLGGEHSLSAPLIAAVHEQYPDLTENQTKRSCYIGLPTGTRQRHYPMGTPQPTYVRHNRSGCHRSQ